jgi:hypothetical protein
MTEMPTHSCAGAASLFTHVQEDVFENINGYAPDDAPEGADYVYYNAGVDMAEPMEVMA